MRYRIFGSCVTRDAFAFTEDPRFRLDQYFARSSLASAFGRGPFSEVRTETIESAFQRRIVEWDLRKTFARTLSEQTYDWIIIDLIDERFDLVRDRSGAVATCSNEYQKAEVLSGVSLETIRSGSDSFMDLWAEGWSRFVEMVDGTCGRDAIVLHKAYWAETTEHGEPFRGQTSESIARANAVLDRMYAIIEADLPPDNALAVPRGSIRGASEHKWGRSPFHYTDDYYVDFMRLLAARCEGE